MKARMLTAGSIVAAAMAASPAALAGDFDYLDFYYVNQSVDTDNVSLLGNNRSDDDGNGFGVKGQAHFAPNWTFHGEYQSAELDDTESDADQLRVGVGVHTAPVNNSIVRWFGKAEYIDFSLDGDSGNAGAIGDQDGFGLHGGARFGFTDLFALTASVGYIDLDSLDGFEGTVGVDYKFTPAIGGFAQYRTDLLDFDNDGDNGNAPSEADVDSDEIRLGVRWHFDATRS